MCGKSTYLICVILLFVPATNARAYLLRDPQLTLYYTFDEVTDVVLDQSGNGHDGIVMGDVTLDPEGMRNGAAKFATGSYLDLDGPNIPSKHIPTTGMTLAAWVKCEYTGGHHAIFNARAADETWLIHPELRSNDNFRWLLRAAGGSTIFDIRAGRVTWNEWLHFCGMYDQASGRGRSLHQRGRVQGARGLQMRRKCRGLASRCSRRGITLTTRDLSRAGWTCSGSSGDPCRKVKSL